MIEAGELVVPETLAAGKVTPEDEGVDPHRLGILAAGILATVPRQNLGADAGKQSGMQSLAEPKQPFVVVFQERSKRTDKGVERDSIVLHFLVRFGTALWRSRVPLPDFGEIEQQLL